MTKAPTTAIAERLLQETAHPLISIYMPAQRAGSDSWQNPIRFRKLLRSAEHDLEVAGVARSKIACLLEPLIGLREDREFWQCQSDGLAVFRSETISEEYRIPAQFPELCVVGSNFHVKPLLMWLADRQTFFVLALSQNSACLYYGSPNGLQKVQGLELPWAGAQQPAELDSKDRMATWCRRIDDALRPLIGHDDLLILAAPELIATVFNEVSRLRALTPIWITCNPDTCSADQLFKQAMPIAVDHFDDLRLEAERRFLDKFCMGKVLIKPKEAIRAAKQGRIETLFVPVGVHVWGEIASNGEIRLSDRQRPQDQDLLNLALIDTWKSGGQVYTVNPQNMLGGDTIVAVARY